MGGVVGRIASDKIRKNGGKVIYTSHGFHFYKKAPIINWLLFYPVEKVLAKKTDCIITINQEDFLLAKTKFSSQKTKVLKTNGVGVDLNRFYRVTINEKIQLREKLGYSANKVILFYAAEFIPRKNHEQIIRCATQLKKISPSIQILLAGRGKTLEDMKKLARKKHVDDIVDFLGYRNDIQDLLGISDILITPSRQEGLPINVVEGMAAGLPVVASNVRGHNDLVKHGINGYLFNIDDDKQFVNSVIAILNRPEKYAQLSTASQKMATNYSLNVVMKQMREIYRSYV